MRIDESKVSVPSRGIAFGAAFQTTRMSEEQLKEVQRLPSSTLPALTRVASSWQKEAMQLAQAPHVIAANTGLGNFRSLGSGTSDAVIQLVSQEVFDGDSDTRRFIEAVSPSVFSAADDILRGLGSVPFVGLALNVALTIVEIVIRSGRSNVPLPPRLEMDPVHDQTEVNIALEVVRSARDWTPLFMPSEGETSEKQGGWVMRVEDQGVLFDRSFAETGFFGCAPGDLFYVAKGVQSRITTDKVTVPNDSRRPPHSVVLRKGENPDSLREYVFSLGDWYPGLAALGRSVWSMVGTANSATMFQVDGYRLIGAWGDYHNSLERFREHVDSYLGTDLNAGSKGFKRGLIANYLGNVGAAFHDARTDDGRPLNRDQLLDLALDANRRPLTQTVGLQAARAASNLVVRQYAACETTLNALVSKDAPAFADRGLREHLHRERRRQLDAGRFDSLDLDEVPDAELRSKIAGRRRTSPGGEGGVGTGVPTDFLDPVSAQRDRELWYDIATKVPRPPDMTGLGVPVPPETEGGGGVLAASLLAAAGLGGALYLRNRNRKPRKKT